MSYKFLNFGTRLICLGSLDEHSINLASPFVVLFPAANKAECDVALKLVALLIEKGCIEFCCVGAEAEFLHDEIDCIIEDKGVYEVITSYEVDEIEGCEYFLFAAGGGCTSLLALISEHQNLLNELKRMISEEC